MKSPVGVISFVFVYKMTVSFSFDLEIASNGADANEVTRASPHDCVNNQPPRSNETSRVIKLDCGGIITLPSPGNSILLDYKSEGIYENWEQCLWLLDSTRNGQRYDVKLEATVECEGFVDSGDALSFLTWGAWEKITSFELKHSQKFRTTRSFSWYYLSFTSNKLLRGSGFLLNLEVVSAKFLSTGVNQAFASSSGLVSINPGTMNIRTAIVINPRRSATQSAKLTVDYLNSRPQNLGKCGTIESVYIYQVGQQGSSKLLRRFCGEEKSVSFETADPVIVGFQARTDVNTSYFCISWM